MAGAVSGARVRAARARSGPCRGAFACLLGGLLLGRIAAGGEIRLREVADAWGLAFRHHHGGSGQRYMVETMVGGVVVFDYDTDGDSDAFFIDGGRLPGYQGEEPRSRLLRNDGTPAAGAGPRFADVTARAGIVVPSYGCGGAAGDVDNDGDLDLLVTAFGPDVLFTNRGDGTFAPSRAGVEDPRWNASAAFADADADGDLDLYVAAYVDFALDNHKFCGAPGERGYCHPDSYHGLVDRYYRNRGDGTFEDRTEAAGLGAAAEAGLGVVWSDLDDDGWPDLYVANDKDPNLLFRNRGDGTFEDVSLLSGAAYGLNGAAEAGMGVEAADLDGDLRTDLVVTNFALETNAYYWNAGNLVFIDRRFQSGLAEPSLRNLGFGVAAADLDHDRDLDLIVANGHILDNAAELSPVKEYAQRNQLMENLGAGRFRERTDAGLDVVRVSRGLATGDLDGDGDLDLVIVNSNQVAEVYENVGAGGDGWLLVDAVGSGAGTVGGTGGSAHAIGGNRLSNRSAIGARVIVRSDGVAQAR